MDPLETPTDGQAPEEQQIPDSERYWADRGRDQGSTAMSDLLFEKEERCLEAFMVTGLFDTWRLSYAMYYGRDVVTGFPVTTDLSFEDDGNTVRVDLNLYQRFVRQGNQMAKGQRPVFKAYAMNSDVSSKKQAEMCDSFVSYCYETNSGERIERDIIETNGVLGAGYGHHTWDLSAGTEYKEQEPIVDQETGQPATTMRQDPTTGEVINEPATRTVTKRTGSPKVQRVYPWNYISEPEETSEEMWCMVREPSVDRYLVAQQWPQHRERILKARDRDDSKYDALGLLKVWVRGLARTDDKATMRHFYHRRCSAMPNGRHIVMFGDVIIYDDALPLDEGLPVVPLRSQLQMTTNLPVSANWNMMVIQRCINKLTSDETTNFSIFGRTDVIVEKGSGLSITQAANGARLFEVNSQTQHLPQFLFGDKRPATNEHLREYFYQSMQTVSGLSATALGQTAPNVNSGQMAALLNNVSVEYRSDDQHAVNLYREQSATVMLQLVKNFAPDRFSAEVVGVHDRPYLKDFKVSEYSGIQKVRVETVSPMQQQTAGKIELIQMLAKLPPEYHAPAIQLIDSGRWDLWIKSESDRDTLIRTENEALQEDPASLAEQQTVDPQTGMPKTTYAGTVQASWSDDHWEHILQHCAVEASLRAAPDAQNPKNQAAIQRVNWHNLQHMQVWRDSDPLLLMMRWPGDPMRLPPPMPGTPMGTMKMGMMDAGTEGRPGAPQLPPGAPPPKQLSSGEDPQPQSQEVGAAGVKIPKPAEPPPGTKPIVNN